MNNAMTIKEYQPKVHTDLPSSNIAFLYDQKNSYGNVVNTYHVTLEELVQGFRNAVLSQIYYLKQCKEQGRHDLVDDQMFSFNYKSKQYKKYWKQYLKAITKNGS